MQRKDGATLSDKLAGSVSDGALLGTWMILVYLRSKWLSKATCRITRHVNTRSCRNRHHGCVGQDRNIWRSVCCIVPRAKMRLKCRECLHGIAEGTRVVDWRWGMWPRSTTSVLWRPATARLGALGRFMWIAMATRTANVAKQVSSCSVFTAAVQSC